MTTTQDRPAEPDGALRRLREIEAHAALIERTSGLGTWRWAVADERPTWSPGIYRLLGIDASQPPSRSIFWENTPPEDAAMVATAIRSVFEHPGPFYYTYRMRRPSDGALRYVETYGDVETDEDGNLVALVGICADVTRRIEVEDQLKSAIEAFRVLTEEANDVICRHALTGRILYISPAVTRTLGYEPRELLGKTLADFCHGDDIPLLEAVRQRLRAPGAAESVTYRVRRNDGEFVWFETMCRSVADAGAKGVSEIITVSRDVTARKTAEIEAGRAREAAESANRTKSRFLANMSHELRTPLNAILGFSDMIRNEMLGEAPPRYREYAQLIHESGALLLDLINDILDMSKIEAGKYELSIQPFSALETIEACARMLRPKAEGAGLTLEIGRGDDVEIEADKRAFKQIALNLLSNAVKFTPQGGKVWAGVAAHGDSVYLIVKDNGVGIPRADLPRLGRPFEQVTLEARLAKSGTGLGLAMVRSLAELHGGDMRIESEEGYGTTVTVSLPRARRSTQQAA